MGDAGQITFFSREEFAEKVPATRSKVVRKSGKKKTGQPSFVSSLAGQDGCAFCNLKRGCQSPQMKVFGKGGARILFVAEAPGEAEDRLGIPLVGPSGQLLQRVVSSCRLSLDDDCWRTNVVQCRPPENRTPTKDEIQSCFPRLRDQIRRLKPDLILTLGGSAARVVLQAPFSVGAMKVRGMLFPSHVWDCWVGCLVHPSFVLRHAMEEADFRRDLLSIFSQYSDSPRSLPTLATKSHETIRASETFEKAVEKIVAENIPVNFDFEATCLSPYADGAEILSCAVADSSEHAFYIPLQSFSKSERLRVDDALRRLFVSDAPKSIQNAQFEWAWAREKFGVEIKNIEQDTMIGAHVYDERKEITSLEFQSFQRWGSDYKKQVDRADLKNAEPEVLARYNSLDAISSFGIAQSQRAAMAAPMLRANDFLMSTIPALSRMSRVGLPVDMKRLNAMRKEMDAEVAELHKEIKSLPSVMSFEAKTGKPFNINSNDQLIDFLFRFLKQTATKRTVKGKPSVDASVLKKFVGSSACKGQVTAFVERLLKIKKCLTMTNTYLAGYSRLVDSNALLHPQYNLDRVITYRSSASDPNSQNIPHRDPFQARVRRVFVPRIGDYLLEVDYSSAEVRVLAMYSLDRTLIRFIREGYDMHRYWAARIHGVKESEVTSEQRSTAKNQWVFPVLYGAWWKSCARSYSAFGKSERFWLGLYEEMKATFPGVFAWQDRLWERFQRDGFIDTFLGFRRHAPSDRKEVLNMPIQGTAFHLLLDAVRLIDAEIIERNFQSRMCAQIHDSILFDLVASEQDAIVEMATRHMTTKRWRWEGEVPMEVDFEIGPNWFDMEKLKAA